MILSTGPEEDFISAIWPTLRYNAKNKASFGFFFFSDQRFCLVRHTTSLLYVPTESRERPVTRQ